MLICDGKPSTKLRTVLKEIFALYSDADAEVQSEELSLTNAMASRLWYRCGMKLANLECILKAKGEKSLNLCFPDFLSLIEQVIQEDETKTHVATPPPSDTTSPIAAFEVRVCR